MALVSKKCVADNPSLDSIRCKLEIKNCLLALFVLVDFRRATTGARMRTRTLKYLVGPHGFLPM
jgi:hypothetical protein